MLRSKSQRRSPVNEDLARRLRRWLVPLAVGYAALWALWWGYALTMGGGLESGQTVSMAISGITAALLLGTAWSFRRIDRANR